MVRASPEPHQPAPRHAPVDEPETELGVAPSNSTTPPEAVATTIPSTTLSSASGALGREVSS